MEVAHARIGRILEGTSQGDLVSRSTNRMKGRKNQPRLGLTERIRSFGAGDRRRAAARLAAAEGLGLGLLRLCARPIPAQVEERERERYVDPNHPRKGGVTQRQRRRRRRAAARRRPRVFFLSSRAFDARGRGMTGGALDCLFRLGPVSWIGSSQRV